MCILNAEASRRSENTLKNMTKNLKWYKNMKISFHFEISIEYDAFSKTLIHSKNNLFNKGESESWT